MTNYELENLFHKTEKRSAELEAKYRSGQRMTRHDCDQPVRRPEHGRAADRSDVRARTWSDRNRELEAPSPRARANFPPG